MKLVKGRDYLVCLIDVTKLDVFYGKVISNITTKRCSNGNLMKTWLLSIEIKGMNKTIHCRTFDGLMGFRKGSQMFFKGTWHFWNGNAYFNVSECNKTGIFTELVIENKEEDDLGWEDIF